MKQKFIVIINQTSLKDSEKFKKTMEQLHSEQKVCFIPSNPYGSKFAENHYIIRTDQYPTEVFEALRCEYKIDLYFGTSSFGVSTNKFGFIIPELEFAAKGIDELCYETEHQLKKPDLSDYTIFETKYVTISDLWGAPDKVSEPMKPWTPDDKHYGSINVVNHFTKFYQQKQAQKHEVMKETGQKLRGLVNMEKGEMAEFIVLEDVDKKYNVAIATSMIVAISPVEADATDTVELILINGLRYKANVDSTVVNLKYT